MDLVQKINYDLTKVDQKNPIFRGTYLELNEELTKTDHILIADLKDILTKCYQALLSLEKVNALTVNEMILLNDIDNLDDEIVVAS